MHSGCFSFSRGPPITPAITPATIFKNVKSHVDGPQIDLRIDHNFNERNIISGFYSWSSQQTANDAALPEVIAGSQASTLGNENWSANGSYTHVFSNTLTNEVRVGYLKEYFTSIPLVANQLGLPEQYGIAGAPPVRGKWRVAEYIYRRP